jgi:hypothetical protein
MHVANNNVIEHAIDTAGAITIEWNPRWDLDCEVWAWDEPGLYVF